MAVSTNWSKMGLLQQGNGLEWAWKSAQNTPTHPTPELLSAPSSRLPPLSSLLAHPLPPKPPSPSSSLIPRKPPKPPQAPRAVLPWGPSCTILPARLVSEVPCGLAHHAGTEVACFHCKSSASIKPKLHYCQPGWFQRFFVAWLITLKRSDLLPLQELCFH